MSGRVRGVRLLLAAAIVAMIGAVVSGLYVLGSPGHQRDLRLDQRRVDDLAFLSRAVDRYAGLHAALPPDLQALDLGVDPTRFTRDPVTAAVYGYAITGTRNYRLCATFAAATPPVEVTGFSALPVLDGVRRPHPAGRHCFELVATTNATPKARTSSRRFSLAVKRRPGNLAEPSHAAAPEPYRAQADDLPAVPDLAVHEGPLGTER